MMRRLLLLALPAVLTGCQTWGPTWSEVTGVRFTFTQLNRTPVVIEKIDGSSAFPNAPGDPIKIEPGKRVIVLRAIPPALTSAAGWRMPEYVLDAQPCQRYYINAQFDSRFGPDWEPVIDGVERIAGCDPSPKAK